MHFQLVTIIERTDLNHTASKFYAGSAFFEFWQRPQMRWLVCIGSYQFLEASDGRF
jgi:hypothetical protein